MVLVQIKHLECIASCMNSREMASLATFMCIGTMVPKKEPKANYIRKQLID